MKKLKILMCLAMALALFAGLQTTALAAVVSDYDNVSEHVSSHVLSHVTSDMIQPYAEGTQNNANGNVVNPRTGMESLVVPGVAALLAAATAAVALTGKKK